MKLDEIRAGGRIPPEAGMRAYEETGAKPAPNWTQCGIAVAAAACGVENSEVFGIIGKPYKAGYVHGFDGRGPRSVLALGVVGRLFPESGVCYRAGLEDGAALRNALRAGLKSEDLSAASLDEELAELRCYEDALPRRARP